MSSTATSMDSIAIDEFLRGQPVGVLAMASDDGVYAIPVSFAYDEDGPDLYFRLGYGPDSQKRAFVEGADHATFVVFDHTDAGWKSVVAEGRLEALSESTLDTSVLQSIERLRIPFYAVHRRPAAELEFSIVRLDVSHLSGVAEPTRTTQVG